MSAYKPNPFVLMSLLLHLGVGLALILAPSYWPWGIGLLVLNHLLIVYAGLWPRATWLGPNLVRLPAAAQARGEVAITIDDGPDPVVTPQVLDILRQHDAKATFFCIGERARAHPELCRAIVAAGHSVENHGQYHRNHNAFLGWTGWLREVGQGQETLTTLTGRRPRFYRALAGLRNPVLEPVLRHLGLHLASWTRRGFDTRSRDPAQVLARLTHQLAAGDILLLHDGNSARTHTGQPVILEVLPQLLRVLAERQLSPVTLDAACASAAP